MPRETYRIWSPAEIQTLREAMQTAMMVPDVHRRYFPHRTIHSLRKKIDELGLGQKAQAVRPVAEYMAPGGPTLAEVYAPEASADEPEDAFLARYVTGATRSIENGSASVPHGWTHGLSRVTLG